METRSDPVPSDGTRSERHTRANPLRRRALRAGPPDRSPARTRSRDAGASAARRALKREEYLEAAASVIGRQGPGVSMEEIAAACGITKPILYRHFGDRRGLVSALADRFASKMFAELDGALKASENGEVLLRTTIDTYLRLLEKEPELYQFVTQRSFDYQGSEGNNMVGEFQREVGRRVAVVMGEKMREAGIDSGGVEPIAQGIVGLVHSAGDWWIERRSMPRARLVSYISDLIWGGLLGMASPATTTPPP